jgi:16S rRNA A1518/A1519 N6-dimethyltransferase RsmA/KsgA/DIM1 with predicted DNA glycosylase/AP lyase activity
MPRKKLMHNLAGMKPKEELVRMLEEIGVSADARPGDLHLADWEKIYKSFSV